MRSKGRALGLYLKDGHLQANLVQRWLDDGARVESEATVELNRWSHVDADLRRVARWRAAFGFI